MAQRRYIAPVVRYKLAGKEFQWYEAIRMLLLGKNVIDGRYIVRIFLKDIISQWQDKTSLLKKQHFVSCLIH